MRKRKKTLVTAEYFTDDKDVISIYAEGTFEAATSNIVIECDCGNTIYDEH